MKIFSTIGAVLGGPAGAAIGAIGDAVVGGISDRNQVKRQNALEMDKFERLREASRRGGYHPLETLRAGGYVDAIAVPRLMSTIAGSNAFDALSDEMTGEAAARRQRQAVDDEIRELERERLKYQVAKSKIGQASLDTGLPGGRPPLASSPVSELKGAGDKYQPGPADRLAAQQSMPPGVIVTQPEQQPSRPLLEPITMPNGRIVYVPEDLSQAVMALGAAESQRIGNMIAKSVNPDWEKIRAEIHSYSPSHKKDLKTLEQNIRRNNPGMSEKDIQALVRQLSGG